MRALEVAGNRNGHASAAIQELIPWVGSPTVGTLRRSVLPPSLFSNPLELDKDR